MAAYIKRRDLVVSASAIGIAAFTLPLSRVHAEPRRGGTLRLGVAGGGATDSLDPATTNTQAPALLNLTAYGYLVEFARDRKALPSVAESWETKPGAKEWVFHLRKGIEFHNGKTLDADDVIYSINRHRGPNSTSMGKSYVSSITDIKADGKNAVVVTLDSGNADLPSVLGSYFFAILPKDFADWQHPIGCGPYVIKSWQPGVRASGTRFANYWRNDRAWFDGFEVTIINDSTARLNALVTGQVDVINRIDRRTVPMLQSDPTVAVVRSSGGMHYCYAMNCTLPEFTDNNVRLALKYAMDREKLLKNIVQDFGKLGNDQPISTADPYFNKALPQRIYDIDKAKFHLKQAGLSNFKVPLSTASNAFQDAPDAAVLYAESAKPAGIEVDVVKEPADSYWTAAWRKKPFFMSYWSGEVTTDIMFTRAWKSDSPSSESQWKNARFDELLLAARSELDDAKRRAMYGEMQQLARDDGGTIIPVFADFIDARSQKLKGFEPNPTRELDGYRIVERAWFEA
jgi:peptide/nickel transport system substrate-binding protein